MSSAAILTRVLVIFAAGAIGAFAIVATGWWGGYRINTTPSYPPGLWRIEPLDRPARIGDRIFICPPDSDMMHEAGNRGYLRPGLCPGGFAPLIKTVLATGGQRVAVSNFISVDGASVTASAIALVDGRGRSLSPWLGGTVPSGELFVFSSFPGSFDSRYFGPIPAAGVLGLARQVLTYEP